MLKVSWIAFATSDHSAVAKKVLEKVLILQKEVLGVEHPNVITILNSLADIYVAQGDYEKAKELLEKTLALREKTLGSESPEVTTNLNDLADIYQEVENLKRRAVEQRIALEEAKKLSYLGNWPPALHIK